VPLGQLSLKGRALRLLGTREHSRAELQRKLVPHEDEPGQLARILDDLQAKGFIDDAARGRVRCCTGVRRGSGAARVKQELQVKGLPAPLVAEAVDMLRGTELQRAREVWQRRFGVVPADARERARQARFLLARGFGGDVVQRVLAGDVEID